jgi:3',5'-nucleoside bisphosphate phosphatase
VTVRADLHIHSCLSPCGDLSMSPRAIVAAALAAGLNLIALTDHNTARNVPAFAAACREVGIAGLYGCEVTTTEEVHVLALFGEQATAVGFGDEVYDSLAGAGRAATASDDQVVVDEDEVIVEVLSRELTSASAFSLAEVGRRVHELGGLFVPAHIDRAAFSVWSQLGFLPPDDYDAVEMIAPADAAPRIDPGSFPVIANSDAHYPDGIGERFTEFEAPAPGFSSLCAALAGRRVSAIVHRRDPGR